MILPSNAWSTWRSNLAIDGFKDEGSEEEGFHSKAFPGNANFGWFFFIEKLPRE